MIPPGTDDRPPLDGFAEGDYSEDRPTDHVDVIIRGAVPHRRLPRVLRSYEDAPGPVPVDVEAIAQAVVQALDGRVAEKPL